MDPVRSNEHISLDLASIGELYHHAIFVLLNLCASGLQAHRLVG